MLAKAKNKPYSFDDDWRSFGRLIADCLGIRVEPSGEVVLPEDKDTPARTSRRAQCPRVATSTRGQSAEAVDNLQRETKKALTERGVDRAIVVRSPSSRKTKTVGFVLQVLFAAIAVGIFWRWQNKAKVKPAKETAAKKPAGRQQRKSA